MGMQIDLGLSKTIAIIDFQLGFNDVQFLELYILYLELLQNILSGRNTVNFHCFERLLIYINDILYNHRKCQSKFALVFQCHLWMISADKKKENE